MKSFPWSRKKISVLSQADRKNLDFFVVPPNGNLLLDEEGKGIRQAVEARHQSHVLNEARHASDGKAPHEVRKVEERQ